MGIGKAPLGHSSKFSTDLSAQTRMFQSRNQQQNEMSPLQKRNQISKTFELNKAMMAKPSRSIVVPSHSSNPSMSYTQQSINHAQQNKEKSKPHSQMSGRSPSKNEEYRTRNDTQKCFADNKPSSSPQAMREEQKFKRHNRNLSSDPPIIPSTGGSFDYKVQKNKTLSFADTQNYQTQQPTSQSFILGNSDNPLVNFEEAKFASKTHGLIISYAANTHQGIQRNYNEDRVSIILNMTKPSKKQNIQQWPKCSYFAIYDGHGGNACADFLKDHLHQIIITQDCFPTNPAQALTNGCLLAEAQFMAAADQPKKHDKSGSCAIIVLIVDNICYVANVGDSRALMSAEGGQKLFILSRDHRPNEDGEKTRIQENGGKIYQTQSIASPINYPGMPFQPGGHLILGPFRVLPGRLSVSRTFGDIEAKYEKFGGKKGVVIAQPEIAQFALQQDFHDFIVLGCDGIFDRLTNLQVQDISWKTFEALKKTQEGLGAYTIHQVCGKIVDAILKAAAIEKSFDNLTIVLVCFQNFKNKYSEAIGDHREDVMKIEEPIIAPIVGSKSFVSGGGTPQMHSNKRISDVRVTTSKSPNRISDFNDSALPQLRKSGITDLLRPKRSSRVPKEPVRKSNESVSLTRPKSKPSEQSTLAAAKAYSITNQISAYKTVNETSTRNKPIASISSQAYWSSSSSKNRRKALPQLNNNKVAPSDETKKDSSRHNSSRK